VAAAPQSALPLVPGGSVNPVTQFVLGSFFLMREMKLSCAVFGNVSLRGAGQSLVVTWRLPAAKTDPSACSVSRPWGCLCSPDPVCPAHTVQSHIKFMVGTFGANIGGIPFFPDILGRFVPNERVVKTYEFLAGLIGEPLVHDLGRIRSGGHSARVSGARYLASIGLELFKLAVPAR
jgi:hypothetical protein